MRKPVVLYELFPLWVLLLSPDSWIITVPALFLLCNLVLLAGMFLFRVEDKREFYTYCIGRAFGFEILSVMLAFAYMAYVFFEWRLDGAAWQVTVPGFLIASISGFLLHYFCTFRYEKSGVRWKMAILLTVTAAPYYFFLRA